MSFGALTFTPIVKQLQEKHGSRRQYERMENAALAEDRLTEHERHFLAGRDSFYMATVGAMGWPYVQHRGGPKGFLKVIDDRTLAMADLRGNRQYIGTGNLLGDNRVAMILVDYPRQARLKILGRVDVLEGAAAAPWLDRVQMPGEKAAIERVYIIHIEAFNWNCPQHITPRFTADEVREAAEPLQRKIKTLQRENDVLRAEIAALQAH